MTKEFFLGTNRGVIRGRLEGQEDHLLERSLAEHRITSLAFQQDMILSGTPNGAFRSTYNGHEWIGANDGLSISHIRWLAFHHEIDGLALAGTEPAGLFVTEDNGESWMERPEVADLRDRFSWFLPYSPEAGCVRGFAFHGSHFFAAVEVGGLMHSDDGGDSWQLVEGSDGRPIFGTPKKGFIHPDVHSILVHPVSAKRLYAPTGGGYFVSVDRGYRWEKRYPACYCRAVWVDPEDPNHQVLGPADSVDRNGRIEETTNGGVSWRSINDGLDTPWSHHMVERFYAHGNQLFAMLSNGQLFIAEIGSWHWRRVFSEAGVIHCLVISNFGENA